LLAARAEKRDHRRLGKDLDLFSIQDEAGPGLIFWHPKGGLIRKEIEGFDQKVAIMETGTVLEAGDAAEAIIGHRQTITVRPEKIRLGSLEDRPNPDEVTAAGVVRDVVYVGAFTRYVVELEAGGELVVLQQNLTMSSMDVLQTRGRHVRLFWNRQHSRAIATAGGDQKKEEIG